MARASATATPRAIAAAAAAAAASEGQARARDASVQLQKSEPAVRTSQWSEPNACSALCLLILEDRRQAEASDSVSKEAEQSCHSRRCRVRSRREVASVDRFDATSEDQHTQGKSPSEPQSLLKRRRTRGKDAEVARPSRSVLPVVIYTQHIAPFLRFDAPVPNMLYIFGGRIPLAGIQTLHRSQGVVQNNVDMLDTWNGIWVQCPPMPVNRAGGAAACLPDGRILLAGGYDERGVLEGLLASCDAYDPFEQSWQSDVAQLGRPRWGHSCAALQGKIYAVGGCSVWEANAQRNAFVETLRSCEVYTPGGNWMPCAPLQVARSGARVVTLQQRYLVVVGGCEDPFGRVAMQATVELFDPNVGHWELLGPTLASPRTCAAVAPVDDHRVLVLGGNDPEHANAQARPEIYRVCTPAGKDQSSTCNIAHAGSGNSSPPEILDLNGVQILASEGPDPLVGRVGCQAVTLNLPGEGSDYPLCDRRYLLAIGGERCDRTREPCMFARTFDFDEQAWVDSALPAPSALPRTAVALCVGLGRVSHTR